MTTPLRQALTFAACAFAALLVCLGAMGPSAERAAEQLPAPIQIIIMGDVTEDPVPAPVYKPQQIIIMDSPSNDLQTAQIDKLDQIIIMGYGHARM